MALSALDHYDVEIKKKSSYYESLSYPNKENPKFINIVVEAETYLPPEDLASVLIFIEESLERKRDKKNDPRTCDIDIIDYDNQILNFKYQNLDFTVPHKELVHRNFVLLPLHEICPNWIHPKTNEDINALIEKLPIEAKNSILKVKES